MADKQMVRFTAVMVILLLSQVVYGGGVTTMVECVSAVSTEVNVPPVVEISPDVSSGKAPLRVRFDGNAWDGDGEVTSVEWDFEGDGLFEVIKSIPKELKGSQRMQALKQELQREYTFVKPGIFHVLAKVTDDKGSSSVESVTIQVYSDMPYLDVVPCNSGFEYMARAGYEAFFDAVSEKGVQFRMGDAWINYRVGNQLFGEVSKAKGVPGGNVMFIFMLDNLGFCLLITFFDSAGNPICGSVAFSNGDRYIWKFKDKVYYVLIDGEWVAMPSDWKPGDPLPPETC